MEPSAGVSLGLTGRIEHTVGDADTALAMGSGDVAVLATPRLVALVEAATVTALARQLAAGRTSVGTRVELDHLAATAVGETVVADATLAAIEGRRLRFEVTVRQGQAVVAQGWVERAVVDRERFLASSRPSTPAAQATTQQRMTEPAP